MNDSQNQESQQELFTDFVREQRQVPDRAPGIAKSHKPILISTTLEQILLACIVMILVFCLVFFLGVLRGRSIVSRMAPRPVSAATGRQEIQVPTAPPSAEAVRPAASLPVPVAIAKKESSFVVVTETPTKPYTIQLLTTKKKNYADEEAAFLRKSGFTSWAAKSGDYYIVCVGSYANKEEARKDLSYFGAKYKGRYLRRK